MTAQPAESAPVDPAMPQETGPRLFRITLTRVTSFVVMTQQRRVVHTGTVEELEAAYKSAQLHCATVGWWGIPFGLVWTTMALFRNAKNMKAIRALAAG